MKNRNITKITGTQVTSKEYASLNFAGMTTDAFNMFSRCQDAIHTLAVYEAQKTDTIDCIKKTGINPKALREMNEEDMTIEQKGLLATYEKDCYNVRTSKKFAEDICIITLSRFMSFDDALEQNFFHFDLPLFLQSIGVLTGDIDNLKKKALAKVKAFTELVIDRHVADRVKRQGDIIVCIEGKSIKNNVIDMTLALIAAFIASGCFQYSEGRFVRVDFTEK